MSDVVAGTPTSGGRGVRYLLVACYTAGGLVSAAVLALLVLLTVDGHPLPLLAAAAGAVVPFLLRGIAYLLGIPRPMRHGGQNSWQRVTARKPMAATVPDWQRFAHFGHTETAGITWIAAAAEFNSIMDSTQKGSLSSGQLAVLRKRMATLQDELPELRRAAVDDEGKWVVRNLEQAIDANLALLWRAEYVRALNEIIEGVNVKGGISSIGQLAQVWQQLTSLRGNVTNAINSVGRVHRRQFDDLAKALDRQLNDLAKVLKAMDR